MDQICTLTDSLRSNGRTRDTKNQPVLCSLVSVCFCLHAVWGGGEGTRLKMLFSAFIQRTLVRARVCMCVFGGNF